MQALPLHRVSSRWYWTGALLLTLALLGWISRYSGAGRSSAVLIAFSVITACTLWCLHLEVRSLRWYWRYPLAVLLACNLFLPALQQSRFEAFNWFGAFGCGLFVYFMLWTAAVHENEPGLQPLATLALLFSIGILTKPAVAISCALLSTVAFFRTNRKFGGIIGSVLLLFTPAILCALAFMILSFLGSEVVHGAVPSIIGVEGENGPGFHNWSLLLKESPILWFPLGILLARIFERKAGISDISYFALIGFLTTVGVANWMPNALTTFDLRMIIYVGAACLLAMAPPEKVVCNALVLSGAAMALVKQL